MLQSLTGAHFCGQCIGQRKEQLRIMQTTSLVISWQKQLTQMFTSPLTDTMTTP